MAKDSYLVLKKISSFFLQNSSTLKCHPHVPSYLWVTFDLWQDNVWPLGRPFVGPDCPKLSFLEPKIVFWAKYPFFGDIIQKNSSISGQKLKKKHFVKLLFGMKSLLDTLHGDLVQISKKHTFFQRRPVAIAVASISFPILLLWNILTFPLQSGSLVGSHPGFVDEERVEHTFPSQSFCVAYTPTVCNSIIALHTVTIHHILRARWFSGAVLMKR